MCIANDEVVRPGRGSSSHQHITVTNALVAEAMSTSSCWWPMATEATFVP
jgi:hypothetical protein